MQKIFRCAAQEQEGSPRANCPKESARRRIQMALPTEAREVSEFNGLEKGLGQETAIELQCVSGTAPKPLLALLSLAFPSGSLTNVRVWLRRFIGYLLVERQRQNRRSNGQGRLAEGPTERLGSLQERLNGQAHPETLALRQATLRSPCPPKSVT